MHSIAPRLALALILTLSLAACDVVGPSDPLAVPNASAEKDGPSMAPGGGIWYSGLRHVPEGNANLVRDLSDLTILGIGSSGLDGVCIDLGAAEGLGVTMEPVGLNAMAINFSGRGQFFDGSDVGFSIDAFPMGGGAGLNFSGLGLPSADVEIFNDGLAIHREINVPAGANFGIGGNAEVVQTVWNVVSATAAVVWANDITIQCPDGGSMVGDEIRFEFHSAVGPLYPAAWEVEHSFRTAPGSQLGSVVLTQTQAARGELVYSGIGNVASGSTPDDAVFAMSTPGAPTTLATSLLEDVTYHPVLGDASYRPVATRGVTLDQGGDSFKIDIDGLSPDAPKSGTQSLIINLSLGWEAGIGLTVAGDYPSGCAAIADARCQGALVIAATAQPGASATVLPVADGFTGFELQRVGFEEETGTVRLIGQAMMGSGEGRRTTIRVTPAVDTALTPAVIEYSYDDIGNFADRFSLGTASDPDTDLPELPQIGS